MIVHDDWVFVHLQKTGGSFTEKYLLENYDCKPVFPKHRGIRTVLPVCIDKDKFGMVRNPYSWYVSWWSKNKQSESTLFPRIFTEKTKGDFNLFIENLYTVDWGAQYDLHSTPINDLNIGVYTYRYISCFCINNMSLAVKEHDKCFLMDNILYTENLREDLSEYLGLKGEERKELMMMDKYHTSEHAPYEEYYNNKSKEIIRERDSIIFEKWGYC